MFDDEEGENEDNGDDNGNDGDEDYEDYEDNNEGEDDEDDCKADEVVPLSKEELSHAYILWWLLLRTSHRSLQQSVKLIGI